MRPPIFIASVTMNTGVDMTCVERLKKYEKELKKEQGSPGENIVTVSGLVGVGTTTVAEILSDELDFDLVSSGQFFRRMANEKNMELTEFFEKHREPDDKPDPDILWDRRALDLAYTRDNLVLEGRMTGPLLCDIAQARVLVVCEEKEAAKRFAGREDMNFQEAIRSLQKRNSQDIKTYKDKYGLDVTNRKYYNVVVDNSKSLVRTKDKVLEKVRQKIDV